MIEMIEMIRHDGCAGCKFEDKYEFEKPCVDCRGTTPYSNPQYETTPDLYEPMKSNNNVNHPTHYNREGALECIDEMILVFGKEATITFCLLNAWKYRYRAADKNGEEDLKKSDWYLNKVAELRGE